MISSKSGRRKSSTKAKTPASQKKTKRAKSSSPARPKLTKQERSKYNLLRDICYIPSPSNNEDAIVAYIESCEFKNFQFKKTKKNSCYYYYTGCKKPGAKTIMFDAHIDQVHLRVVNTTDYYDKGYIIAISVGFESDTLSGNSVVHLKSGMKGAVVTIPPHLRMEQYMKTTDTEVSYVCIDLGLSAKDVYKMIKVGDIIMFDTSYYIMNNKYAVSTGLDNKVSVYTLLKMLEHFDKNIDELSHNVYFHFSSREEVDIGSYAPLLKTEFDEIIVFDADIATDNEYISDNLIGTIVLDRGVVFTHNYEDDTVLTKKLIQVSDDNNIPYQESFSSSFGGSNALAYARMFDSYTQFVGIPLRNMHSPSEVVSLRDLDTAVKLGIEYLKTK
jgi:putative aminopeptidase FrvX